MRAALVHDWLTGMRGGERVLEALLELLPEAEIFTLVHRPGTVSALIEDRPIHTSFLQRLPLGRRAYRYFLPLYPRAVESLDLAGFDLVVSSSHAVAKGVRVPPGVPHLCYCHTPMRYLWDQYDAYFGPGRAGLPVRAAMALLAPSMRRWDVASSARVDRFVANSRHVADRIHRLYGRRAAVVHPPVRVERFRPGSGRGDYYLVLGALVPYKRVDLAVDGFRELDRPLVVAGEGSAATGLRRRAGPRTTFLGRVDDAAVPGLLAGARALLLPGVEDFGITVVEALASGTPVIARGRGGALETVRGLASRNGDVPTGVFFHEPTPEALRDAVLRFEDADFDAEAVAASAAPFGTDRFLRAMETEIERALAGAGGREDR